MTDFINRELSEIKADGKSPTEYAEAGFERKKSIDDFASAEDYIKHFNIDDAGIIKSVKLKFKSIS